MRTNIELGDSLVEEAFRLTNVRCHHLQQADQLRAAHPHHAQNDWKGSCRCTG